jgi:hypothetical protein
MVRRALSYMRSLQYVYVQHFEVRTWVSIIIPPLYQTVTV